MAQSAEKRASKRSSAAAAAQAEENGRSEVSDGTAVDMTDLEYVRGLIEAVDHSGIDRLDIARGGIRIRIAKTPAASGQPIFMPAAAPAAPTHVTQPAPVPAPPPPPAAEPAAAVANLIDIKSPMVGTFYRAPAPDAPPYAEVGTSVTKGQTLCILEAMKLMNELESEVDGIVREVLVEDADPVEYGQVLFRVEPAGSK
ncbi:MAG TPA: acetyl-CoA carboxylase biotin carboxyl carrier protein [Longimicrobiales bacterium]|nr:acetyl-CoA carboxylase biotin carboxyl carrier protein [Longimicrobiales bacterium]